MHSPIFEDFDIWKVHACRFQFFKFSKCRNNRENGGVRTHWINQNGGQLFTILGGYCYCSVPWTFELIIRSYNVAKEIPIAWIMDDQQNAKLITTINCVKAERHYF